MENSFFSKKLYTTKNPITESHSDDSYNNRVNIPHHNSLDNLFNAQEEILSIPIPEKENIIKIEEDKISYCKHAINKMISKLMIEVKDKLNYSTLDKLEVVFVLIIQLIGFLPGLSKKGISQHRMLQSRLINPVDCEAKIEEIYENSKFNFNVVRIVSALLGVTFLAIRFIIKRGHPNFKYVFHIAAPISQLFFFLCYSAFSSSKQMVYAMPNYLYDPCIRYPRNLDNVGGEINGMYNITICFNILLGWLYLSTFLPTIDARERRRVERNIRNLLREVQGFFA